MSDKKILELEKKVNQLEEKFEPTDIVVKFETLEDKDRALETLSHTNCEPYIFRYLCVSKSAEKILREKGISFIYPNNEDKAELTRGTPEYQRALKKFRQHFFSKYITRDPREI